MVALLPALLELISPLLPELLQLLPLLWSQRCTEPLTKLLAFLAHLLAMAAYLLLPLLEELPKLLLLLWGKL